MALYCILINIEKQNILKKLFSGYPDVNKCVSDKVKPSCILKYIDFLEKALIMLNMFFPTFVTQLFIFKYIYFVYICIT